MNHIELDYAWRDLQRHVHDSIRRYGRNAARCETGRLLACGIVGVCAGMIYPTWMSYPGASLRQFLIAALVLTGIAMFGITTGFTCRAEINRDLRRRCVKLEWELCNPSSANQLRHVHIELRYIEMDRNELASPSIRFYMQTLPACCAIGIAAGLIAFLIERLPVNSL